MTIAAPTRNSARDHHRRSPLADITMLVILAEGACPGCTDRRSGLIAVERMRALGSSVFHPHARPPASAPRAAVGKCVLLASAFSIYGWRNLLRVLQVDHASVDSRPDFVTFVGSRDVTDDERCRGARRPA